jgi:hypothetical protein
LKDYPKCDQEVVSTADELWGDCDGKNVTEHAYGKGKIYWGKPIAEVLGSLQIPADFASKHDNADAGIRYIHRREPDAGSLLRRQPQRELRRGGLHVPHHRKAAGAMAPRHWPDGEGRRLFVRRRDNDRPHPLRPLWLDFRGLP